MSLYGIDSFPNSSHGQDMRESRESSYSSHYRDSSISSSNLSTSVGALTAEERKEKVKKYRYLDRP